MNESNKSLNVENDVDLEKRLQEIEEIQNRQQKRIDQHHIILFGNNKSVGLFRRVTVVELLALGLLIPLVVELAISIILLVRFVR